MKQKAELKTLPVHPTRKNKKHLSLTNMILLLTRDLGLHSEDFELLTIPDIMEMDNQKYGSEQKTTNDTKNMTSDKLMSLL